MGNTTKEIIESISKLDLTKYPHAEVVELMGQLSKFGAIVVTINPGKPIMRARLNNNGEIFSTKSQLSFKPAPFNKTYQRASTPKMTMFYGALIPESIKEGDLDNSRVVGAYEATPLLRDKLSKGYQKLTFGKWIVKKPIELIAIVQHADFEKSNSYLKEMNLAFKDFMNNNPEHKEDTIIVTDFFAKQFANPSTHQDSDYLLSAVFTEMVVKRNFAGVIYPSVRTIGQGFNVAITPEIADSSLELVVAGECSIYRNHEKVIVDNDTIVELKEGQTDFELQPVIDHHAGRDHCLKYIGVSSFEELISL